MKPTLHVLGGHGMNCCNHGGKGVSLPPGLWSFGSRRPNIGAFGHGTETVRTLELHHRRWLWAVLGWNLAAILVASWVAS